MAYQGAYYGEQNKGYEPPQGSHAGHPPPYGGPPQGQHGAPPQGQYGGPPQGQYGSPLTQTQQTTVVINQPQAQKWEPGTQPWTTGICGCFEDCGICMLGWCCPLCLACTIASRMRETCCIACCVYQSTIIMRTKLRTIYGIQGSICEDCICDAYCSPCTLCQMAREMNNRGM